MSIYQHVEQAMPENQEPFVLDRRLKQDLCASLLRETGLSQMWLDDRPSAEIEEIARTVQGLGPEQLLAVRFVHSIWTGSDGPSLVELSRLSESSKEKAYCFLLGTPE